MEDLEGLQYLVQNIICAVKISVNTKAKIPQTKFHKKAHFADITKLGNISKIRAKQPSMTANWLPWTWMIWLYTCVRYWPCRSLVPRGPFCHALTSLTRNITPYWNDVWWFVCFLTDLVYFHLKIFCIFTLATWNFLL